MKLHKIIFISIGIFWSFVSYAEKKDSLFLALQQTTNKEDQADIYSQIGSSYFMKNNFDSTRLFYRKAIQQYKDNKTKISKKTIYPLRMISISFAMQGRLDSAIFYMSKTLQGYQKLQDTLNIAFSYNNLGLMHTNYNNYKLGMENLLMALEYKNKLKDSYPAEQLDIASTNLNLGIVFSYLGDYQDALRCYKKAKNEYKLQHDNLGIARTQIQIANSYIETKQHERADLIFNDLITSKIFEKHPHILSKLYNNYGSLLFKEKKYSKAKDILSKAYQLNTEQGNTRSSAINLNNLANIALSEQKYAKSIYLANKSYQTTKENHFILQEQSAAQILSKAYEKIENYKQSIFYHNVNTVLSDSLYNIEKNKLLTEMEAKFQNAEKDKEIALKTLKIERIKRSRFLFIFLTSLLIIFSIFLYYLYYLRRKRNQALKKANNTKDKLISIIAHDLKNPAIAQKTAIEQLIQNFDVIDENMLQRNLNALHRSSSSQVTLLLNLLNWAYAQSGYIEHNPVSFVFNDIVQKNIELFNTTAYNKQIDLKMECENDIIVFADKSMINTVLRNLISNALKFSHPNTSIFVKVNRQNDKQALCLVKDNGIGISNEKLKNLFNVDNRELSKGTAGEEGSGLGLFLCKEMVERNGGTLSINSIEDKGTTITFTVPLANKN